MNPSSRRKSKLRGNKGFSPNYSRKVSALVLELAEEIASRDSEPGVFRNAVALAIVLRNMPLESEVGQTEDMDHLREWLAERGELDLQMELARLLDLRRTRYGTDRRFVIDYKLDFRPRGPVLTVSSLDLDRPENRNFKP